MKGRTTALTPGLAVLALLSMACCAQAAVDMPWWAQYMGRTQFSAEDESQMAAKLEKDHLTPLVAGRESAEVTGARTDALALTQDGRATAEFRAAVSKVVVQKLDALLPQAVAQRNRLGVAIVVARVQNPESLPLLLKLLGDGGSGEVYSSVRYWAAKGLAGDGVRAAILNGTVPIRVVAAKLGEALQRETDVLCVSQLFKVLQALGTESVTDVLIDGAAAKAKSEAFDLSRREAVEAMKTAVEALRQAYDRPPAASKQRIVATLAQILVRTPPHGDSLDLIVAIDDVLSAMTKEKTALADAVKEQRSQSRLLDPKLIDLVWLQQLNWVELLLKTDNRQIRLAARPAALDWTPEESAKVVRKNAAAP